MMTLLSWENGNCVHNPALWFNGECAYIASSLYQRTIIMLNDQGRNSKIRADPILSEVQNEPCIIAFVNNNHFIVCEGCKVELSNLHPLIFDRFYRKWKAVARRYLNTSAE